MNNKITKILLVEDEVNLAFSLRFNLEQEGFFVVYAKDGKQALDFYQSEGPFSAIILDVLLPEIDGFQVLEEIRKDDLKIGILLLTAKASDEDKLHGFSLGVDDYLTKPFQLAELLMRVKRIVERSTYFNETIVVSHFSESCALSYGPFHLDDNSLVFRGPKGEFKLTVLEADILKEFLKNPQKVLSRKYLLDKVWGVSQTVETRTVDNFMVRLRRIMEDDPTNPRYLVSVRGRGYCLSVE